MDSGPPRPSCTVTLSATGDVQTNVQTALIEAVSGSVICFEDGTYQFTNTLSLSMRNVTLQGVGNGAILDFAGQTSGDNSILATGDDFTMQYLTVRNVRANGVRVEGATGVTFRHVLADWSAGSATENGKYAIYPVQCTNVLVEDCEVVGASDAGIYVGQSTNVIVRRNDVHGNVAGIEIENCTNSCVYDNVTRDNTAGILVFTLPGLPVMGEGGAKIHNNVVEGNNRANFAERGTIVGDVPPGIGVMVMAADHTEVHHNTIRQNDSSGIVVLDFRSGNPNTPIPQGYDPTAQDTCIHDNTFAENGNDPRGLINTLRAAPVEDILFDGRTDEGGCTDNTMHQLCLANNGSATFLCINFPLFANLSEDPTPFNCSCTTRMCPSF
jgi:parallel beta-helix repeat protein